MGRGGREGDAAAGAWSSLPLNVERRRIWPAMILPLYMSYLKGGVCHETHVTRHTSHVTRQPAALPRALLPIGVPRAVKVLLGGW